MVARSSTTGSMADGAKQTIYGAGSKHKINGNGKVQVTTQFITVYGDPWISTTWSLRLAGFSAGIATHVIVFVGTTNAVSRSLQVAFQFGNASWLHGCLTVVDSMSDPNCMC